MNHAAVDAGLENIRQVAVPAEWADAEDAPKGAGVACSDPKLKKYVDEVMVPANDMRGDFLPVSAFTDTADGALPQGTAAFEKRGIAVSVPQWIPANCIQCNQCSYVCPHAAIRPFGFDKEELAKAPDGLRAAVESVFSSASAQSANEALEKARTKVVEAFGADAIGADGVLASDYVSLPYGKAYVEDDLLGRLPRRSDRVFVIREYSHGEFAVHRAFTRKSHHPGGIRISCIIGGIN